MASIVQDEYEPASRNSSKSLDKGDRRVAALPKPVCRCDFLSLVGGLQLCLIQCAMISPTLLVSVQLVLPTEAGLESCLVPGQRIVQVRPALVCLESILV